MGITKLAVIAMGLIVGSSAVAREQFNLRLNDRETNGSAMLPLKQLLKQQYNVNADNYTLAGVRLVAKSEHGQATAMLRIGNWNSNALRIYGNPRDFNRPAPETFGNIDFNGNRGNGVWQIELQGHVKTRNVILVVDRNGGGGGGGGGGGNVRYQNVRCDSSGNALNRCPVNGRIVSLRVVQKHSISPCDYERSYGVYNQGIWVNRGCRATFEVGTR